MPADRGTGAERDIVLREVVKRLGGRTVLDHLSLDIHADQLLVIVGASGSGKSVLLKHLIGLLRPDEGTVRVGGVDLWSVSDAERNSIRRRFGMSFQDGALFDSMSVFENVAFPLRRHARMGEQDIAQRVRTCLELVRLPGLEGRRPSELSTGMRRRVGFARAIALDPEILLFDEPTAGLDNVMVTVIGQLVRALTRRLHATTVMVTHDLHSARIVADRIALLLNGRVVADAPASSFFELEHPAVRQLVEGRPEGPLSTGVSPEGVA